MPDSFVPRLTLKRGALVAAANWQTVVIQASTEALFKGVVAVPTIGGIMLAALVIGADPPTLLSLELRDMLATVAALLTARPATLAAFVLAVAVAVIGASVVACAVKAGTVAVVVASEREAGVLEEPPLDIARVAAAGRFSLERFGDAVRAFGGRFVQLGACLLVLYAIAGAASVQLLIGFGEDRAWLLAALTTAGLAAVVSLVNLAYLLAQVVLVAEDCSVWTAGRLVLVLVARARRLIWRVFISVLAVVAGATVASVLATAALGLVGFVPFVWFAVLPLQLVAWMVRGLLFQFIAVGAVAGYASVYRDARSRAETSVDVPEASHVPAARGAASVEAPVPPASSSAAR